MNTIHVLVSKAICTGCRYGPQTSSSKTGTEILPTSIVRGTQPVVLNVAEHLSSMCVCVHVLLAEVIEKAFYKSLHMKTNVQVVIRLVGIPNDTVTRRLDLCQAW